jgi:hypothetical protein
MLVLPHVLPAIAAMRKKGLKLLLVGASQILQPAYFDPCKALLHMLPVLGHTGICCADPGSACQHNVCLQLCEATHSAYCSNYQMHSLPPLHVLCFGCLQVGLTLVSVVAKLAYSYDLGAWGFLEGMMSARNHPNILFWNITRFNPFYCMLEVGATVGRSAGTLDYSTVVVPTHLCSGLSIYL